MRLISIVVIFSASFLFQACMSIPKESVQLSEVIGQDIEILHQSHKRAIMLYYSKMKNDISSFVDEVYTPYLINSMITDELERFKIDSTSIFSYMKDPKNPKNLNALANDMNMFQAAVEEDVVLMRKELLEPIEKQEFEVISALEEAYGNVAMANSALTGYLASARKLKESQQTALRVAGLEGFDEKVTQNIILASDKVGEMVDYGKGLDMKAANISTKIDSITAIIKGVIK